RHDEMADGSSALLGSRVAQSESRVGLDSSRLQSQASDHHLRGPAPAAGPTGIASLRWTAVSAVAARQQRPTSHTACFAGNDAAANGGADGYFHVRTSTNLPAI